MTTTERIEKFILTQNCESVTFGKSPSGGLYIGARQGIPTGPEGNMTLATHQLSDEPLSEMLEKLAKQIEHCEGIGVKSIRVKSKLNSN